MRELSEPHGRRLLAETSPYLREHATNPVDWWPWSADALAEAQRLDRPIMLSIGYSACHWCHVMARESFADEATAAVLNTRFVNIKVDREERPDLDRIYQIAQQLLTQRGGGWPLTMFLAPKDQVPFFGGTYFPNEPRGGLPSFVQLLERVAEFYAAHRDEITAQNSRLLAAFDSLAGPTEPAAALPDATPLERARLALERSFDATCGGFTPAPKFPHAGYVDRCLRSWALTAAGAEPDLKALYMATLTLTRMAEGGICDQVAGGFARYSVDRDWMIPHFEKMLYDNALLLGLYAEAALATGERAFAATAIAIVDWAQAEMHAPEGACYSSLDADSEGEEGRYYVFDRAELEQRLPPREYACLARRYGLDLPPNFEGHAWHLHTRRSFEEIAVEDGSTAAEVESLVAAALQHLREIRAGRVRPHRDEKILTSWNGLFAHGLAVAARALARADYAAQATAAVDFLRRALWSHGRLQATYKDGRAHVAGFLDDYAFLAQALLALLECRWRSSDLLFAVQLSDALLDHFEDEERGGFWFTPDDGEPLMHRPKSFADDALPSGNGVAARVLYLLGCLLGESRYLAAAERTLRAAGPALAEYPLGHAALLDALEEQRLGLELVIVRGAAEPARAWCAAVQCLYAPRRFCVAIPAGEPDLPPALEAKTAGLGTLAYVCVGTHCEAPIDSLERLIARLRDGA
jgi:uncharacterized protein YyaL (SSP411 family)